MAHDGTRNRDLTAKQMYAVSCLMLAGNVKDAALLARIGRRTLCRWMKEPAFISAIRTAESGVLMAANRRLTALTEKAIENIDRILGDDSAPDTVRLRASLAVLEHTLRWREQTVLEERIGELERKTGVMP